MGINKRFIAKNGLDNNNQTIANVADPVNAQDVATKNFASNASNLTSGTIPDTRIPSSFLKTDVNGNIAITGTGARITGDFSNATRANRVMFQTNAPNSGGVISTIPNGTGIGSGLRAYALSDPNNSPNIAVRCTDSFGIVEVGAGDTASYLPLSMWVNNMERMRIDTAGNVGIGIGTGGSKLNVLGNLELRGPQNGTATSAVAFLKGADGVQAGYWGYGTTASPMEYVNDRATGHAWYDNGSERMRIDSSGKVGIGTQAPQEALHVKGGSNSVIVSEGGNSYGAFSAKSYGTNSSYIFFSNTTSGERHRIASNNDEILQFGVGTAATETLRITPIADVGIGLGAPTAASYGRRLRVYNLETTNLGSNAGVTLVTKNTAGTGDSVFDILKNPFGNAYLHNTEPSDNANFIFAINNSEKLYITSNGSILAVNSNGGIGYGSGSGGTVIQPTSKSTAVTLNKPNGIITTSNSAMPPGSSIQFVVNNSCVWVDDVVVLNQRDYTIPSTSYRIRVSAVAYGQFAVIIENLTGTTVSEAIPIKFAIIKGSLA